VTLVRGHSGVRSLTPTPPAGAGRWRSERWATDVVNEQAVQDLRGLRGIAADSWLDGRVSHLASYGFWVDLTTLTGSAARGLVHASEALRETVAVPGGGVRVRVIGVDVPSGQLSLSMLPFAGAKEPAVGRMADVRQEPVAARSARLRQDALAPFRQVMACDWFQGVVHSLATDGVLVDVTPPGGGLPCLGFAPAARIASLRIAGASGMAAQFPAGRSVQVRVIGIELSADGLPSDRRTTQGDAVLRLSMLGDPDAVTADLEEQLQLVQGKGPARQPAPALPRQPAPAAPRQPAHVPPRQAVPLQEQALGRFPVVKERPPGSLPVVQDDASDGTDSDEDLDAVLDRLGRPQAAQAVQAAQAAPARVSYGMPAGPQASVTSRMPTDSRAPLSDWQDLSALRTIPSGRWLPGVVHHRASFGVYISMQVPGRADTVWGLVHLSEMPEAVFLDAGSDVQVRVTNVDVARGRLALSLVAPSGVEVAAPAADVEPPGSQDLSALSSFPPDRWLPGTVHHPASFGAYVSVQVPGSSDAALGLVHLSEMPEVVVLEPGTGVQVRVTMVDVPLGRLALSMLAPSSAEVPSAAPGSAAAQWPARDASPFGTDWVQAISSAEWLDATVRSVTSYGLIVDMSPPLRFGPGRGGIMSVSGLVYTTELDHYPEDLSREFGVGQQVWVRLLDTAADPDGLLPLSMRGASSDVEADVAARRAADEGREGEYSEDEVAHEPSRGGPEAEAIRRSVSAFLDVPPSQWHTGVVMNESPFGMVVGLVPPAGGDVARGLIPRSELDQGSTASGSLVRVRVASVDLHRGVLVLTVRSP